MNIIKIITTILMVGVINMLYSQQIIISTDDQVNLQTSFRGDIQWQQQLGKESSWEDIEGATYSPYLVSGIKDSTYYRGVITEGTCNPFYTDTILVKLNLDALYWSDPSTWGGAKPLNGETVTIPSGKTIILDENVNLSGLYIEGELHFADMDLNLSSNFIAINGILQIGTNENPFENKAIITLTGDNNENIMGMGSRGVMVHSGGQLNLYAKTPNVLWTKIDEHLNLDENNTTLKETVDWKIGDEVIIGPTDYYFPGDGASGTQAFTLTSVEGGQIQLSEGSNSFRWGKLQYATSSGMSLSANNQLTSPAPDTDTTSTPKILDERAPIGLLSRNIVIQAPDDELWSANGFGAHIMIMGTNSQAHIDGVEIRRGGQRGRIRRYPIHWHNLSYAGTETLADAEGQFIKNSSINISKNRGIVIHGTNGILVENNVIFNIEGHGIFTEDAVERRNTFDGNLVLKVRNPPNGSALKLHEIGGSSERGASGFWVSNPDNVIVNNHVADCQSIGYWLAFTTRPWGDNSSVLNEHGSLLNPSRLMFGLFENNTSHSNRLEGIRLDDVEIDEAGNTFPHQYQSTTDGLNPVWPFPSLRRFTLSGYSVWKNGSNGIWDRGLWANNYEVVSADNCGRFFAGSGSDGVIERSLVIGTSLNNTLRPANADFAAGYSSSTPVGFATYHSAFDIRNNIIINFPLQEETRSGAFATDDYYERPVDKGHVRNINNLLVDAHYGVKLQAKFEWFVLAGALWDPSGNWTGVEGNNYFVYDRPFFTLEDEKYEVPPGSTSGGVVVSGPFYGINDFIVNLSNEPYNALMEIEVSRLDSTLATVDIWQVAGAGSLDWLLAPKRHFAAQANGIFDLQFPTINNIQDVAISIENMLDPTDAVVLGIEYEAASINQVYTSSYGNFLDPAHAAWIPETETFKQVYAQVENLDEVLKSSGGTYWQDLDNKKVWIKIKGGIDQLWNDEDYPATSDERLYRKFYLRIY